MGAGRLLEGRARETLWQALHCTHDDIGAAIESVANTLYFDHDLDPEQVERMRQAVVDLEYVTETYLAELCEGTESRTDDSDRNPSWQPLNRRGTGATTDSS